MKYAFFPGCVLEAAAKEAYIATLKVAERLGIELVEIPGWTCCGASHIQDIEPLAALATNARNIALAEQMGLPILTVCNTCTLMLRQAKQKLDSKEKERVNAILAPTGIQYQGTSDITHLLWVLNREYSLSKVSSHVKRPLTGLKVAGYYGCHLLRPPDVMNFEDHAAPQSLERLIQALGATPVDFDAKLKCCGFHAVYPAEADAMKMSGGCAMSAAQAGANCMVTPCPLCQMQLDMYQPEGRQAVSGNYELPVFHLAQLIGLALGLAADELGLQRHVVTAKMPF